MKKVVVLVFISSLFLLPANSFALSCVEPPPPDVAFDEYDAVLIGSVEKVESNSSRKKLTIEVQKSFKGVEEKTVSVFEDITWGESQENATYLFFLDRDGDKWIHPLCSPTTHNTDLADEYFADKQEIALQEVKSVESDSTNTTLVIFTAALLVAAVAGALILSKKRRNKIS